MTIKHLIFVFCTLSASHVLFAQKEKTIRVNVLFDTDQFELKKKEKEAINKCFDSLDMERVKAVYLLGHTDARGDSVYNIRLSNNRINAVDAFLKSIGIVEQIQQKRGIGENKPVADNVSDMGMQKNRRVEILIKYQVGTVILFKDTIRSIPKTTVVDTCQSDTVMEIVNGILFNVDKCNLKTLKNCVEIETIGNVDELRRSRLNMQDATGEDLISDGMFRLKWNKACGPDCNNFKLKWLMPEAEYNKSGFNFYKYNETDALWGNMARKNIKKMTLRGVKYVSIELDCSDFGSWFNKDKPKKGPVFHKIKIPHNWKIVSMQSGTGVRNFYYKPYKKTETFDRENVWKILFLPNSTITIVNKKTSDTLLVKVEDLMPRKVKVFRKRLIGSYGDGTQDWPHKGFPHIKTGKWMPPFPYKKYKLKRRTIKLLRR